MPGSASEGMPEKIATNAASPPVEAPMPTIGKFLVALSIGDLEIFAPLRYLLASGELPSL